MFEGLYKRSPTLARHRNGPLAAERELFLRHLADDERQRREQLVIAASYLLAVAERLRLSDRGQQAIGLGEIEEQAERWSVRATGRFRKGTRSDRARQRFAGFAVRWLKFMGRLEEPKIPANPFDEWLIEYSDYLGHERGLIESTIRANCSNVRRFLNRLAESPETLSVISIDRVQRTLIDQLEEANWKRNTVQAYLGAVRGFFRFAERRGYPVCKHHSRSLDPALPDRLSARRT